MKKRIILFFAMAALLTMCALGVNAEIVSGDCGANGDNVKWEFDTESGVLTISGKGEMKNHSYYTSVPWSSYRERISTITIENGVTNIGSYTFYGCTGLTYITIPNSVTSIGSVAFSNCTYLTSLTIPNNVTSIENGAFYDCTGLATIAIPDSVTNIGINAFNGCTNLEKIVIPDNVIRIGIGAFDNTAWYTAWYQAQSDGLIYINRVLYKYKGSMPEDTEIIIKPDTVSISDSVFKSCTNLIGVTIPDSVTSIGDYSFYNCTNLKSISFPCSKISVGNYAFSGCTNISELYLSDIAAWCNYSYNPFLESLQSIVLYLNGEKVSDLVIPEGVTSISPTAFSGCGSLTNIIIPDSVTNIGNHAFSNCTNITSVALGNQVKSIGDSAFSGCSSLENITISDSVTNIGNHAFSNCTNITSVALGNQVKSIGDSAFSGCSSLENITISDSVTNIGNHAFSNCTNITSVALGNQVKSIGDSAFSGCSSLENITISDSVTQIGNSAFSDCSNITSVTLGNQVKIIKDKAFSGCYSLKNVYYTGSPTNWNEISIGYNTEFKKAKLYYTHCGKDLSWSWESAIKTLTISGNGTMYDFNLPSQLPWYAEQVNIETVVIEQGVTSIGSIFQGCTNLTSLIIPDSVTSISEKTFSDCTNLAFVDISSLAAWCQIDFFDNPLSKGGVVLYVDGKKAINITIPNNVEYISANAFKGYDSLKSLVLPDSVKSIEENAFYGCSRLSNIVFGNGLTTIEKNAYSGCTSLTSVIIPNSVTNIGSFAFNGVSSVYLYDLSAWCRISFASNSFSFHSLYLNGTRVEQLILPSDISMISAYTFAKTSGIKRVVIPKNVTTIYPNAFYGCNDITEIYYTGTADEWECVKIATNNGSLSKATVYTDYVPDAMKITFSANTTDAVSSLPNAASAIGSYTIPATVPVRTGYKFLGWSTTPDGKASYQPGDTVEISADTTFYAVWAEADKVALSGITLKSTAYDPISTIPTGDFIAEVTLTNNTYTAACTVLLATYDADGRMLDVRYLYADPDTGKTITFGTGLSDPNGKIAKIKAFVLSDLRAFTILGEAAELTKA